MRYAKLTATTLATTMLMLSPVIAAEGFVKKDELGEHIRSYLLENPEVLTEAMEALQKKQMDKIAKETEDAAKNNEDAIYNNPKTPFAGNADAEHVIVEFFDYNCPACRKMVGDLQKLMKHHGEDVKFIFKEFPIFGQASEDVSRVALAVNQIDPEKYFDYHVKMMGYEGRITPETAVLIAKDVGLDTDEVQKVADSDAVRDLLKQNTKLATDLKVRGTPFLLVNGKATPHAMSYEMFMEELKLKAVK